MWVPSGAHSRVAFNPIRLTLLHALCSQLQTWQRLCLLPVWAAFQKRRVSSPAPMLSGSPTKISSSARRARLQDALHPYWGQTELHSTTDTNFMWMEYLLFQLKKAFYKHDTNEMNYVFCVYFAKVTILCSFSSQFLPPSRRLFLPTLVFYLQYVSSLICLRCAIDFKKYSTLVCSVS